MNPLKRKETMMNNKNKNTTDNATPYRGFSLNKVDAPVKQKNEPMASVIKSKNDLRVRGDKA